MAKILVVGAINWDLVIEVERLPTRDRIVGGRAAAERLGGGAANTAVGLVQLDHQVTLLGYVGTDHYGDRILAAIRRHGLDTNSIRRRLGPSSQAIVFIDGTAAGAVVVLSGALMEEASADLLNGGYDALYIAVPRRGYVPLMRAVPKGVKVFAVFPPQDTDAWPAHVLLGSAAELDTSVFDDPSDAFSNKCCSVLEWLIVTRGESGATAYGSHRSIHARARHVKPVDTTGAGDALVAGVIDRLLNGCAIEEALRFGVDWGTASTLVRQSVPARPPNL